MLDRKTFIIGVLSLSAVILLVANVLAPHSAIASYNTIKDNDYSLVCANAVQGGDIIYVTDNRTGMMAAFAYVPAQKSLVLQDVQPVQNAFAKALHNKPAR